MPVLGMGRAKNAGERELAHKIMKTAAIAYLTSSTGTRFHTGTASGSE